MPLSKHSSKTTKIIFITALLLAITSFGYSQYVRYTYVINTGSTSLDLIHADLSYAYEDAVEDLSTINNFLSHLSAKHPELSQLETSRVETLIDIERQAIEGLFKGFIESHNEYFQLRLINGIGAELLRVEVPNQASQAIITPISELQNKGDSQYFNRIRRVEGSSLANKFIFSAPSLNVENGKIEKPYRPTIRVISTNIASGDDSIYLVANLYADAFLENSIAQLGPLEEFFAIVNQDGTWFRGLTREQDYSADLNPSMTMQTSLPESWAYINKRLKNDATLGSIHADNGQLLHRGLSPSENDIRILKTHEEYLNPYLHFLHLILHIPDLDLNQTISAMKDHLGIWFDRELRTVKDPSLDASGHS